jgi:hypothetical protein
MPFSLEGKKNKLIIRIEFPICIPSAAGKRREVRCLFYISLGTAGSK